jgi:hypothetical protein
MKVKFELTGWAGILFAIALVLACAALLSWSGVGAQWLDKPIREATIGQVFLVLWAANIISK